MTAPQCLGISSPKPFEDAAAQAKSPAVRNVACAASAADVGAVDGDDKAVCVLSVRRQCALKQVVSASERRSSCGLTACLAHARTLRTARRRSSAPAGSHSWPCSPGAPPGLLSAATHCCTPLSAVATSPGVHDKGCRWHGQVRKLLPDAQQPGVHGAQHDGGCGAGPGHDCDRGPDLHATCGLRLLQVPVRRPGRAHLAHRPARRRARLHSCSAHHMAAPPDAACGS